MYCRRKDVRMTRNRNRLLVSGDVGGTKTILGLFALDSTSPIPLVSETYESRRYPCLESIIEAFLAGNPARPRCASFAVAGFVRNGSAQVTNLPWCIDAASIKDRFRIPKVFLLNDVEALAWAVPLFDKRKLQALNVGEPAPRGTSAVVAPGTGCGEAFLTWDGDRYTAHPSEGGHADFAPVDPDQIDLLRFLQQEFEHVSVERVCSGTGLHRIYRFLRDKRGMVEDPWLSDRLETAQDPAPVISEAALAG
jgi:glucokinase